MLNRSVCLLVAVAAVGYAVPSASAQASFTGIGFLPGGHNSYGRDVSADGSVVVGEATTTGMLRVRLVDTTVSVDSPSDGEGPQACKLEDVLPRSGNFNENLGLCFRVGLLGPSDCHDAIILGRLRNRFAHRRRPLTFMDPSVVSDLARLKCVTPYEKAGIVHAGRARFLTAAVQLMARFLLTDRSWGNPH